MLGIFAVHYYNSHYVKMAFRIFSTVYAGTSRYAYIDGLESRNYDFRRNINPRAAGFLLQALMIYIY